MTSHHFLLLQLLVAILLALKKLEADYYPCILKIICFLTQKEALAYSSLVKVSQLLGVKLLNHSLL